MPKHATLNHPLTLPLKNSTHVRTRAHTHTHVSGPFRDDTLHHHLPLLMRYRRALVKHAISGVCVSVKQTRQFRLK